MSKMTQGLLALVFATLVVGVPLYGQRKTSVLTAEEIVRANLTASNAYDVVEQLRPRWFATRGLARLPSPPPNSPMSGTAAGTPAEGLKSVGVRVWLNEHNAGDADYLKTIPAERVLSMRWYSQNEAASRFGPTDDAAIEVVLKR